MYLRFFVLYIFFFFKQKTAYEMRISDWSSDACSSDLPMEIADQTFLFKRTVRQTALNHGVYATFMAKPMQREPGSSMHIHQSVRDLATGRSEERRVGEEGVST